MGALAKYFSAIGRTVKTLGDGFAVTFSYMFRKPVTIQYPDRTEKPVVSMLPERSRGILENDIERCTGCGMCSKQCPIGCIHVQVEKNEETKQRMLVRFDIDAAKCMYCGLCVEVCPANCLHHSHEFEGAMGDVHRLMLKFVDKPRPVAKPPKKGEEIKGKPLGSIVRKLLADQWTPADQFEVDLGWAPPPPPPKPKPPAEKPAAKPDAAKPAAKPADKAEAKPETKSDAKPEAKPEAKPDAKAEAKPEAKPDAKAEAKPEAKPDAKAEAKPEAKPDAKAEAKPEAKPDAKAEAKAEGKPEAEGEDGKKTGAAGGKAGVGGSDAEKKGGSDTGEPGTSGSGGSA